ncbi:hypothetical protein FUA48_10685 [Flavobacterium alkalisoli]|uniref:Uncharacterized protein n=1 Tax=Flavobacterium alkalisoli TaxID=2602769 RepID=A0A5B9FUT8_9FLAO|nr:hypothetical protein [Flavobacterium alkalisoli]QEE50029.1 hypothetical protein FUA48_10685 [Flavobacterium alkalisoli]
MKRIALLIFVLFIGIYCRAQVKTYVCKYILDGYIEHTDYIQLTFKNDTLTKGVYCGNWDGVSFVADIETAESKDCNDSYNLKFHLKNYKFSKEPVSPYVKPDFIEPEPNDDDLPMEFHSIGREVNSYWGKVSDKKLLLKVAMWFYGSRTDELIFNRIEDE